MKIENVIKKFNRELLYSCPKCNSVSNIVEKSLVCTNGHSYDFSKKGYVHLINNYKATKYSTELFVARKNIFENNFYIHIVEELAKHIDNENIQTVIDAGCGEGYYIKYLKQIFPSKYFYGLDNSKEAIELAVKNDKLNPYMLANLSNIPFSDKQVDAILNILTPANYEQFFKVLKTDGIIIKVIPTKNYLKEIRELFYNNEYSNEDTTTLLEKYCKIESRKIVSKNFELSKEDAKNFLMMTPLTFSKKITEEDIEKLKNITVELEVIIAKQK